MYQHECYKHNQNIQDYNIFCKLINAVKPFVSVAIPTYKCVTAMKMCVIETQKHSPLQKCVTACGFNIFQYIKHEIIRSC